MDVGRLRRGELIAGVSGIILFIVMFLSWFGADLGPADELAEAQAKFLPVRNALNP